MLNLTQKTHLSTRKCSIFGSQIVLLQPTELWNAMELIPLISFLLMKFEILVHGQKIPQTVQTAHTIQNKNTELKADIDRKDKIINKHCLRIAQNII